MTQAEGPPELSFPSPEVALITLNRPDNANRLEPQDLAALAQMLDDCEAASEVKALVLTGRGRFFSAGFDLRALASDMGEAKAPQSESAFERVANRLAASRLPTVAALNGPVIGGATDLALACDFRIGIPNIYMQMPAAKFGLPLYAGALQRYVNCMGLNTAKRLVLQAQKLEAPAMLACGFLTDLVQTDELMTLALSQAKTMAAMPAKNLSALKTVLNAAALGQGTDQPQLDVLAAAFDPQVILHNLQAAKAARSKD